MRGGELLAPSHCPTASSEISPIHPLPIKHPLLQLSSLADSEVTDTKATERDVTIHVRTASLRQEQDTQARQLLVIKLKLFMHFRLRENSV